MFSSCYVFDQDLSHFDVSKATSFGASIYGAFVNVALCRFLTVPSLAESMFQRAYQFNGNVAVRKAFVALVSHPPHRCCSLTADLFCPDMEHTQRYKHGEYH
jgi:surface protein